MISLWLVRSYRMRIRTVEEMIREDSKIFVGVEDWGDSSDEDV